MPGGRGIATILAVAFLLGLPEGASSQVVTTFAAGLKEPRCMTFDSAGNLYVSALVSTVGVVLRLPAGGGPATVFATGFADPRGLVFGATGDLYVADGGWFEADPGRLWKVPAAGPKVMLARGFQGAAFLALHPSGDLLLGERTGRRLRRITPEGVVSQYGPPLGGVTEFVGQFVIEPSGDVLVAVTGSIKRLSADAASLTTFTSGLGDVYGLARASDGELFVSRHGSADILRIPSSGLAAPYAGSTEGCGDGLLADAQFRAPLGLAMDGSRLFIADRDCGAVRMIEQPTPSERTSWGRLKVSYR